MRVTVRITLLMVLGLMAVISVYGLFTASETIIHYKNNFVRRFPQHVAEQMASTDLGYNSYYLAGTDGGKIVLGNTTTPLLVTVLDSTLRDKKTFRIDIDRKGLQLRTPHLKISNGKFYLYEGLVPAVYSGSVKDWKAHEQFIGGRFFSLFEPIDTTIAAIRYFKPGKGENILGIANLKNPIDSRYGEHLLQKQIDGVFDTDGSLHYDAETGRLVYIYLYRNQYIVFKPTTAVEYRAHTIDTMSRARLDLVATGKGNIKTFRKPPLIVNKTADAANGLLFVNSTLPGQYESDILWKTASIIDVYDLKEKTYRSSFPIYDINHKKMSSFLVSGNKLYALIGNHIVHYSLRHNLTARNKKDTSIK